MRASTANGNAFPQPRSPTSKARRGFDPSRVTLIRIFIKSPWQRIFLFKMERKTETGHTRVRVRAHTHTHTHTHKHPNRWQEDKRILLGASLVAQWLRIRLPMQGTRVQALVWEDPTCRGATKPVRHNY